MAKKKPTAAEREKAWEERLKKEIAARKKAGLPAISLKSLKERRRRFWDRMNSSGWVIIDELEGEELRKWQETSHAWREARKGNYKPGIKLGLFPEDAGKKRKNDVDEATRRIKRNLRNLPESKLGELKKANDEILKGNWEPAIKLGVAEKDPPPGVLLVWLNDRWTYLFGKSLPLMYPVTVDEIPMIERCIRKKDPKEMYDWLDMREKKRRAEGVIW